MADEYQAGVCGGNWWNSSRSIFGSSLCASSVPLGNSNFAWPNDHLLDMKSSCRSNDESGNSDESVVLQELPKHDSTLQILGIGLNSSSTSDNWNHTLIHGNDKSESSYPSILLQDLNSSMNYQQESGVDCSSNSFKQDFTLGMNHPITSSTNTDDQSTTMISSTFPMDSSFSNYTSSLLQTLFENDPPNPTQQQQPQLQQSMFAANNNQPVSFPTSSLNYRPDLNDFSPSLPKFPNSLMRPSLALPKQTPSDFPNYSINATAPLYNTSSATSLNNMRGNLLPSMHQQLLQSPTFNEKSSVPNRTSKSNVEELRESSSRVAKKSGNNVPTLKRARIETPSPLPSFKVRKEKLGDRITALQQLVSPFGKTDTASVLHEAIEYIKFLHDQVNVLSTPYLKNGSTSQQQQQIVDKVKEQDLRSRGLCLVPISSTFPVATETTSDFWTPNFGGTTFR
ncbi:Transcription factor [Capsicum baccatum]|uniref:Transcription factor n=1 Tax=Capsicum baccatum TaxID=33114 RepID=A0A2G2VAD7_CAPBA|nr:Transcription factor [Capsicum baccatum]